MDKRSDRHKKPKTMNPKYNNVDYPPYESPIFLEDNPEEAKKVQKRLEAEARKNAQKKQESHTHRPEAIKIKEKAKPKEEPIDEDDIDTEDEYIYRESIGEKLGRILSNKIALGVIAGILLIGGIGAYAAMNRSSNNNAGTATSDSAVTLTEEQVSEALASTKEAIITLQDQLNPSYLYNASAEGLVSSQIKNTDTGEELSKSSDLFKELNYDPTNDMAGTNNTAFRTEALPLYTQSFLGPNFDPAIIDQVKQSYDEIELPSKSSLDGDDQGYDAVKDAYQNINVQISALELKSSIESKLNDLTITPVYTAPTVNTETILKAEVPADTISSITADIAKLESLSENQKLVVAMYNKALGVIDGQQSKIDDARSAITTANDESSDKNIKTAETAIKAVTSKSIQETLIDELSNAKDTLAKNNELDKAIKEQDELKEKLQKEYDEKVTKLKEDHQKEIDTLTKTKDADYTKKVEDMTNEKNEAVQAAKDELQSKLDSLQSENAQLQQSNSALQEANRQLQEQIDALNK